MWRSIRSHSWKSAGRQDARSDIIAEQLSETETDIDDNGNTLCRWPFRLFVDSPIIQAYKFTSSHFQKKISDIPLPVSPPIFSVFEAEKGSNTKIDQQELPLCDSEIKTSRDHDPSKAQRDQLCTSLDHSLASTPSNTNISSVGWPLLHQPFLANKLSYSSTRSHKMSVIEWALQLPDRPKEFLSQGTDLKEHQMESRERQDNIAENISKDCILEMCNTHLCNASRVKCKIQGFCQGKLLKEFQFLELLVATGNFSSKKIIGKGGCSQVYRGLLSDGQMVAVKRLNKSTPSSEEEFLTEVEIISNLDHCRIATLLGYCIETQHFLLVYKLAPEGNLESKLHSGKENIVLSWEARFQVATGIAEALNYLHDGCDRPVIHRDVKSSNILLSSDLQPQLTDFGLAKWASTTSPHITCSNIVGTFGYLAPEYFMFGKVSEKTDVYSFGVVLLELITGRRPINESNPKGEENLVVWARQLLKDESTFHQLIDPKLDGIYSATQLKNMMIAASHCLQQSSESRPRMHQVLKLLRGEMEDFENSEQLESICDDGYNLPSYGEKNIHSHLTLAMVGLDDDAATQISTDHSVNLARSYKFLLYLCGRYSRACSFG